MFESIRTRLIADWKWVLANSWSVRLIATAAFLQGAEIALPFFVDSFPRGVFAALSFFVTASAFVARLVAQKRMEE